MAYTNENQIGEVTEVTGVATIIRTDGSQESVTLGTEVFQGDIVETSDAGAVNIGFIDDSSFAVSNDARIAIDEFVFDPETEGGVQDFSVMKGVFMYTSGLIGRENPDQVEIDTPIGSIGIRGTIIGGDINPDGESSVSVLEGAIVVRNDGGEQLLTNQYETVTLTSRDVAPSEAQQLDASRIANNFESVKDVSPSLFSSLSDQIAQDNSANPNQANDTGEKPIDAAEEQEEIKKEVEAKADNNEEVILEKAAPEAETLEESQLEVKELGDAPELKTVGINLDTQPDAPKGRLGALRDRLKANDDRDTLDNSEINLTPQKISFVSGGSIDENTNGGSSPVIGTVSLSNAANVTYSLIGPNAADYALDTITGVLRYVGGNSSGNFENGDVLNVGIRAVDNNTGRITNQGLQISLNDVNEAPNSKLALEDVYDVGVLNTTTDDIGVLALNGNLGTGTRIGRLDVNDPEGKTFVEDDFTITGNIQGSIASATYFDVIEDDGQFYLELKAGFQMVDRGSFRTIFDGTSDVVGLNVSNPTIDIGVKISDGSLNNTSEITLKIAETTNITTGGTFNAISTDDIIIGNELDNNIHLVDSEFQFINGGEGEDGLFLNNGSGPFQHDFTNGTQNQDLSSIEQIYFDLGNWDDTLKIDIDNLIRLIKTSNAEYNGQNDFVISVNGAFQGFESTNGIFFEDAGGSNVKLTDVGFTKLADREDPSGELNYEVFELEGVGIVSIDSQIVNADTGGL